MIVALVVIATIAVILSVADTGEDRLEGSDARIGLPVDAANYAAGATTTTLQSSTTTTTGSGTIHVSALTATPLASQGSPTSKWISNVTITVLDGANGAASGVTVTGNWESGGTGQAGTCVTDVTGSCSIQRTNNNDNDPTEGFTITNLSKSGFTYVTTGPTNVVVSCTPPLDTGCN